MTNKKLYKGVEENITQKERERQVMSIGALSLNQLYNVYGSQYRGISNYDPYMQGIYDDSSLYDGMMMPGMPKDGIDDGKISFGSKVKNFFKGIGNTIKGAVKSLATPKGLLKAAGCIALCVATGGAAAPILAGIGVAKGALTVAKGAVAAGRATTDEEAEMAWQTMGSGTFQAAASAVALKGSVGAIKSVGNGSLSAGMKSTFENSVAGRVLSNSSVGQTFAGIKASGGSTVEAFKGAAGVARAGAKGFGSKLIGKIKTTDYQGLLNAVKGKAGSYASQVKSSATGMANEIMATVKAVGVKSAIKIYGKDAVDKAVELGQKAGVKFGEYAEVSNMPVKDFGILVGSNQL